MNHLTLMLVLLLASTSALSEIEKRGNPCETGICLYWWPRLPAVPGWHHEPESSEQYAVNALSPDGSTFSNAEVVMYAKASYKPRMPGIESVEDVIANDKKEFLEQSPGVAVSETKALRTGDGQELRSFTFFPSEQGNWERVSYGEEGEYYLIFTVSSRSKAAYEKALPAYEAMIHAYREKL